ncbi:MAG: tetratricopeptide repeat protein [Prolixibacteraceae bacterium]
MNKLTLLFTGLLFSIFVFGQNSEFDKLIKEGIAFHDKGEYGKAINTYKKALEINPNSSLVNYEISFSYMLAEDYKNAEKYSQKTIKLNGDNILQAIVTYGNALDMQGKTKKAIKVYEKAFEDYDNYLLYYNHAITCFNSDQLDKAYESAIKAINNNSSHASSHLILSKIMDKKGERIKAMLPLYFFLLIEPNSSRSELEYPNLRNYIDYGVTEQSNKDVNVLVPTNDDPNFGAAEMMISLLKASNGLEENEGKDELELFAENTYGLFAILGELKKENSGFWWDFYVPFYYDIATENLTKPFSYYISLSQGEEVNKWLEDNDDEFQRFKEWMNK